MAKKGKRIYENPPLNASLEDLTEWLHSQMSQNDNKPILMFTLFCLGVEPEIYQNFYERLLKTPGGKLLKSQPGLARLLADVGKQVPTPLWDPNPPMSFKKKSIAIPMKDSDKKSLLLKLQIAGITKPPVWREVLVPASFTFLQLHEIIQIVFNWSDTHLWHFEDKAYNSDFVVKLEDDDDFDMNHDTVYDAESTPISSLLKSKEDKIEYLYDFGDDWIVKISVKDIFEKKNSSAELIKLKGDNMVDDIGGIWGYLDYRDFFHNIEKAGKKEIEEFLENTWFDSKEEFMDFMLNLSPDIETINEDLKDI